MTVAKLGSHRKPQPAPYPSPTTTKSYSLVIVRIQNLRIKSPSIPPISLPSTRSLQVTFYLTTVTNPSWVKWNIIFHRLPYSTVFHITAIYITLHFPSLTSKVMYPGELNGGNNALVRTSFKQIILPRLLPSSRRYLSTSSHVAVTRLSTHSVC